MKVLQVIAANIPAIVCVVCGLIGAIHGANGWGWFLFAGVLLANSPRFIRVGDNSKRK